MAASSLFKGRLNKIPNIKMIYFKFYAYDLFYNDFSNVLFNHCLAQASIHLRVSLLTHQ